MTATEIVARARSAVNLPIRYGMGHGDSKPDQPVPGIVVNGVRFCDCSDFVAWVYRYERDEYNTDAIIRDATGTQKLWRVIAAPTPGCIAVWGGKFSGGKRVRPGHVYVVTEVPANWRSHNLRGVHCSASNPPGFAVQETATSSLGRAVAAGRRWCFATRVSR